MCGITGFYGSLAYEDLLRATDKLKHRGPDSSGVWVEKDIGLGHRRLSILDLSESGAQPMHSDFGVISFNGEIYNYKELRSELSEPKFKGTSDTEVLLYAIDEWGIKKALSKTIGMFALAYFDKRTRTLFLARDRAGEKPLYYGKVGNTWFFASELKAFCGLPGFLDQESEESVNEFLQYGYIDAPRTIYKNVFSLRPGHYLNLMTQEEYPYWTPFERIEIPETFEDQCHDLKHLLINSVRGQMIADVPLGAFLSGGIDSSLIVSLMQSISTKPIKTFSIGFDDMGVNEAPFARSIAEFLKTDHTELTCSEKDALALVDLLPKIYDEPFADSSQIPTLLVSKLARQHVTVSLSGDGGDELFGGYPRYIKVAKLWSLIKYLPARRLFANALSSLQFRDVKFARLCALLKAESLEEFYSSNISLFPGFNSFTKPSVLGASDIDSLMRSDFLSYLPSDILVKVDRASMYYSLEGRMPFLDHRIIQFAFSLPMSSKIKAWTGKIILREILSEYIPRSLFERPKQGFSVPLKRWLKGPLLEWAQDCMQSKYGKEISSQFPEIPKRWEEFLSKGLWSEHFFWAVLMLIQWRKNKTEMSRPI
jgi:asparagine synthase (glutamine-hydrolysing)